MPKQKILPFLTRLTRHNSKEWMHAHQAEYLEAKAAWLTEIERILQRLRQHDPQFETVTARQAIFRITNTNRHFHPDKPIYRDYFGCAPVQDMYRPGIYAVVGPREIFIGGGLHKPPPASLKKVRSAIDYDGDRLRDILAAPAFRSFFGDLELHDDRVKTRPRGYDIEHPHIDLLRHKSFTVRRPVTEKEFLSDDFPALFERAFLLLQPLNNYLAQAIDFAE